MAARSIHESIGNLDSEVANKAGCLTKIQKKKNKQKQKQKNKQQQPQKTIHHHQQQKDKNKKNRQDWLYSCPQLHTPCHLLVLIVVVQ